MLTGEQATRWETVLSTIAGLLPAGGGRVLMDGVDDGGLAGRFADGLAAGVRQVGRECHRLVGAELAGRPGTAGASRGAGVPSPETVLIVGGPAAGPSLGWDMVVRLRSRYFRVDQGGRCADIVVDVDDPGWPVVRRVVPGLAGDGRWHVRESQAFFAVRAAGWDTKFGEDLPA